MAIEVLKNQKMWLGGYEFTGVLNAMALDDGVDLKEATVFGDAAIRRIASLSSVRAQFEGYSRQPEMTGLETGMGLVDVPMSVGPLDGNEGSVAVSFLAAQASYSPGGQHGEMYAFSVSAEGSDGVPLVHGILGHNASRTSTANGTARQLGAVSATQKLYATLHVITVSGTNPQLDVTVESDDIEGFTGAETRITFAQASAIGSEWAAPIVGPITDTWFRVVWAIGGTDTPTFEFVVVFGIQ